MAMPPLAIVTLRVRSFRNIASADVTLNPRLNVVCGDNAQGKTSLLEATYVLATSRSFRTNRVADVIAFKTDAAHVDAHVREQDINRHQAVGISHLGRFAEVEGKPSRPLAQYAVLTPVVVFDATSLSLVTGSGPERRKLMDRLALYASPSSYVDALAYARAMRARRRVLETRGSTSRDLDPWEELMARHGSSWASARAAAVHSLAVFAHEVFLAIGRMTSSLSMGFRPGAPDDPNAFRAALVQAREHDRRHRSDAVGRHKDDIHFALDSRSARFNASQGERRVIVLSTKLAEIRLLRRLRGVTPIFLLDDISTELDTTRTEAFMSAVRDADPQVLLTTTRPELIPHRNLWTASDHAHHCLRAGTLVPS
ncbi:MAG: DNA replication and repair protein RecF [Polyangiaceae bacterium]|jgi:DNA replication and repair protein RecF